MKLLIAGKRGYKDYAVVKAEIIKLLTELLEEGRITKADKKDLVIVSGGEPSGVDALGERFADEYGFKKNIYPAEWNKHGNYAGPMRNREMALVADYGLIIWSNDSPGSANMIANMQLAGKPYKQVII